MPGCCFSLLQFLCVPWGQAWGAQGGPGMRCIACCKASTLPLAPPPPESLPVHPCSAWWAAADHGKLLLGGLRQAGGSFSAHEPTFPPSPFVQKSIPMSGPFRLPVLSLRHSSSLLLGAGSVNTRVSGPEPPAGSSLQHFKAVVACFLVEAGHPTVAVCRVSHLISHVWRFFAFLRSKAVDCLS